MNKIPILTVSCFRDLPLLELQAQSISLYLDKEIPVYIIVNEDDTSPWFSVFDQTIRHYYKNHELTILPKRYFRCAWEQWVPSSVNPWAVGWETQQILKLAMSIHIRESGYLVLDSQNFLIKPWNSSEYSSVNNTVPYRQGFNAMPDLIWDQYSTDLGIDIANLDKDEFSTCTPIFLNASVAKSLIENKGGTYEFSTWFKFASKVKSEFILYFLWMKKQGNLNQFHYKITDWAQPYLRDSREHFVENFNNFIDQIGKLEDRKWASINHRSWGDMTADQYEIMQNTLKNFNLFPKFDEYRLNYIDYKF